MSLPWIIWTQQRSGSIALAEALRPLTAQPIAELEPFDGSVEPRQFSWASALPDPRPALEAVCRAGWCFKHVYDRLPLAFNLALAQATERAGYRQIHLRRLNEFARLVSLGVAENEVAWLNDSPATHETLALIRAGRRAILPLDVRSLVERSRAAGEQWRAIAPHLTRLLAVATERVTARQPATRRPELRAILRHLEMPAEGLSAMETHLAQSGQNTFSVWNKIPNLNELRTALI